MNNESTLEKRRGDNHRTTIVHKVIACDKIQFAFNLTVRKVTGSKNEPVIEERATAKVSSPNDKSA
jgi:hypothetical protein